jgi:hypothetical protein
VPNLAVQTVGVPEEEAETIFVYEDSRGSPRRSPRALRLYSGSFFVFHAKTPDMAGLARAFDTQILGWGGLHILETGTEGEVLHRVLLSQDAEDLNTGGAD